MDYKTNRKPVEGGQNVVDPRDWRWRRCEWLTVSREAVTTAICHHSNALMQTDEEFVKHYKRKMLGEQKKFTVQKLYKCN